MIENSYLKHVLYTIVCLFGAVCMGVAGLVKGEHLPLYMILCATFGLVAGLWISNIVDVYFARKLEVNTGNEDAMLERTGEFRIPNAGEYVQLPDGTLAIAGCFPPDEKRWILRKVPND